jgi:hypothetical protein
MPRIDKRRVVEGVALVALGVGIAKAIDAFVEPLETLIMGETLNDRKIRRWNEKYKRDAADTKGEDDGGYEDIRRETKAWHDGHRPPGSHSGHSSRHSCSTQPSPTVSQSRVRQSSEAPLEALTRLHEDPDTGEGTTTWPWGQDKERWTVREGPRPRKIFDPVTLLEDSDDSDSDEDIPLTFVKPITMDDLELREQLEKEAKLQEKLAKEAEIQEQLSKEAEIREQLAREAGIQRQLEKDVELQEKLAKETEDQGTFIQGLEEIQNLGYSRNSLSVAGSDISRQASTAQTSVDEENTKRGNESEIFVDALENLSFPDLSDVAIMSKGDDPKSENKNHGHTCDDICRVTRLCITKV